MRKGPAACGGGVLPDDVPVGSRHKGLVALRVIPERPVPVLQSAVLEVPQPRRAREANFR